ncbi:MAG: hypothetical protein OHK0021_09680 [Bryobacter sp.]
MYRICLYLPLILICSCGPNARQLTDRGNAYLAQKKYAEAELEFRKALQANKPPAAAHFGLGEALWNGKKYQEAVEAWRAAVELDPDSLAYRAKLADVLLTVQLSAGLEDTALLAEAGRLVGYMQQRNPKSFDTLRLTGALEAARENWSKAAEAFAATMALSPPGNQEARLGYAKSLFQMGERAKARSLVEEQLKQQPDWAPGHDLLVAFFTMEGNAAGARTALEQKAKALPGGDVQLELARFHFLQHNPAAAREALSRLPSETPAELLLRAGDLLLAHNDWNGAREYYARVAGSTGPQALRGELRIVNGLESQGDTAAALRQATTLLERYPQEPLVRSARAALLAQSPNGGLRRQALEEFAQLAQAYPKDARVQFNYAMALRRTGDEARAREFLRASQGADPEYAPAFVLQGQMALEDGRANEGLRLADMALQFEPESEKAHFLRLNSLATLGRFDEARAGLRGYLADRPDHFEASILEGMIALAEKRFAAAEQSFRGVEKPAATDLRPLTGLVGALAGQQRLPEALDKVRAAVAAQPESASLRFLEARVLLDAGQAPASLAIMEDLVAKTPNNAPFQTHLARTFAAQRDWPRAAAAQQKAAELLPKDSAAQCSLGDYLALSGQNAEAEKHYRRALALDSNSFAANNNLASLLAEEGRALDEAERYARKALSIRDNAPDAQDTLAWILWKRDRDSNSRKVFETLARRYPGNPVYRAHLEAANSGVLTKP